MKLNYFKNQVKNLNIKNKNWTPNANNQTIKLNISNLIKKIMQVKKL